MDLGLYLLKMPFRKIIGFLVPIFRDTNPNWISVALLPVGGLMAWSYWMAISQQRYLFLLVAIVLGFIRMVVATLDGLLAVTYNKSTAVGDILNRVTPELCDLLLYPVIIFSLGRMDLLGLSVITMSWAISFFGLLGAPSACPVQSVGPCGQTDRLATLMLFTLLQYLSGSLQWQIDFFDILLKWILIGGSLTLGLRFYRTLKAASLKDQSAKV